MSYVLVFIGAGIGGALRHGVNVAAVRLLGAGYPYGTLAVNVLGGLLMGLVAGYWALRSGLSQPVRLFLATGMLGGFTTFSAFSLDAALLWESNRPWAAAGYVAVSAAGSIGALLAGMLLVRALSGSGAA